MNGYTNSIDTDSGIGTILSHFSTSYIDHVVDDSLKMKYRPFITEPMPNIIDVLNRQFNAILVNSPDYVEKVNEVRSESFKEIILKICSYYNLTFCGDMENMGEQLYSVAHILYDIFIARFTEYMNNFFVNYIMNNADSIYSYLESDETSIKPKDISGIAKNYIDPKYVLIHANVNKVMYNMASYDITLDQLLQYFLGPQYYNISMLLMDNGDIYKNHYACYILNQISSAGVLTNVKLNLQARTQEAMKI